MEEKLFSSEDIQLIQNTLEEKCNDLICIPRIEIFSSIKNQLSRTLEEYKFNLALTKAIKEKDIIGFELRKGRKGGICREDAYKKYDEEQKRIIKEKEEKRNSCLIKIEKDQYLAKIKPIILLTFLFDVLDAKAEKDGNVELNNSVLKVQEIKMLTKYILHCCDGKILAA